MGVEVGGGWDGEVVRFSDLEVTLFYFILLVSLDLRRQQGSVLLVCLLLQEGQGNPVMVMVVKKADSVFQCICK